MHRFRQGMLLVAALCAGSAHAVVLGTRDQGQALIFPYYNAQAGNTTLVTLANHGDDGKVVQLRVAEGEIGDTALVANIYLAGRDNWSGAIAADSQTGGAFLLTDDASCVMPALGSGVPNQPGRRVQALHVDDDKPAADGAARVREGWIEAIEVASIASGTTADRLVGNVAGVARDCGAIASAWSSGGYWANLPRRDLVNPRGGIAGYMAVINVAAGTFFGAPAVALDEFRVDPADRPRGSGASVVRHVVPSPRNLLTLADTITDPEARSVVARVVADNRGLELTYPLERSIDAVSAVLAASELASDFDTRNELGATSSFVQLFPTKRFYTNPSLLPPGTTAPLPPFRTMYNTLAPFSVIEREWLLITDREGEPLVDSGGVQFGGCEASVRHAATALAVTVPGGNARDALIGSRYHGPMSQVCGGGDGALLHATGTVTLKLGQPTFGAGPIALRPSREGLRLAGLPVIALRLINYVNTGAQQGVLANYSSALPMSAVTRCVDGAGQGCEP
jgi:hypothetical protein